MPVIRTGRNYSVKPEMVIIPKKEEEDDQPLVLLEPKQEIVEAKLEEPEPPHLPYTNTRYVVYGAGTNKKGNHSENRFHGPYVQYPVRYAYDNGDSTFQQLSNGQEVWIGRVLGWTRMGREGEKKYFRIRNGGEWYYI